MSSNEPPYSGAKPTESPTTDESERSETGASAVRTQTGQVLVEAEANVTKDEELARAIRKAGLGISSAVLVLEKADSPSSAGDLKPKSSGGAPLKTSRVEEAGPVTVIGPPPNRSGKVETATGSEKSQGIPSKYRVEEAGMGSRAVAVAGPPPNRERKKGKAKISEKKGWSLFKDRVEEAGPVTPEKPPQAVYERTDLKAGKDRKYRAQKGRVEETGAATIVGPPQDTKKEKVDVAPLFPNKSIPTRDASYEEPPTPPALPPSARKTVAGMPTPTTDTIYDEPPTPPALLPTARKNATELIEPAPELSVPDGDTNESPANNEALPDSSMSKNPYDDIKAEAWVVSDEDQEKGPRESGEVEDNAIAFATAKRVSPLFRFVQDHCALVSILSLVFVGAIAGISSYFALRNNPATPSPTASMVPSSLPSFSPTSAPTITCNMPSNERSNAVVEIISDALLDSSFLNDSTLPASKALQWLAFEDSLSPPLCPGKDTQRLMQRFGLVLMNFAMRGDEWAYESSEQSIQFMETVNECDWAAVDCPSDTNTVTRIKLGGRNLGGEFPIDVFSMFAELKELDLANNKIIGPIPNEISKLSKLEFLYLSNNRLTATLPETIGTLSLLAELDISGNFIEGTVPQSLLGLATLKVLNLARNKLEGGLLPGQSSLGRFLSVQNSLGNLTSLETLDLSENEMTGSIPSNLPPRLIHLLLQKNKFNGTLPESIYDLSDLEELHLYQNSLSGELSEDIGNLVNLRSLSLSDNNFSGTLPDEIGELVALEVARFDYNPQLNGTIPSSLSKLENMTLFSILGTGLVGDVSDSVCALTSENGGYLEHLVTTCENQTLGAVCNPEDNICCSCCDCREEKVELPPPIRSICTYFDRDRDPAGGFYFFEGLGAANNRSTLISEIVSYISWDLQDDTAQAKALDWLVNEDEMFINFSLDNTTDLLLRYSLAVLYFATDGPNWLYCSKNESSLCGSGRFLGKEPFLSNTPVCDWAGITCEDHNYMSIMLDYNGLRGEIPADELVGLCIASLSLRGNPGTSLNFGNSELGFLLIESLELLDLSENELTGQLDFPLLSSGQGAIYLSNNRLNGTLPSGCCSRMTVLDLSHNLLSGTIPAVFGFEQDFTFIDGQFQQQLQPSDTLTEIHLAHNFLTGIVPDTLGELQNLEILKLEGNRLIGSIPDEICDLTFEYGGDLEYLWADCAGADAEVSCECCSKCFYTFEDAPSPAPVDSQSSSMLPTIGLEGF